MITIICSGSRGDFQPYIALAQALIKLNQKVRMVGFKEFESFIKSYDIDYFSIEADFEKLGVDPKMLDEAKSADNPLKMLLTFNKMKKYGIQVAEEMFGGFAGSELIIYHPGCTIGYFAAQELKIPAVLATPFPMHRTNEYLSVIAYGKRKATSFNKIMSYKMLQSMLWLASSYSVKHYWKQRFNRLPNHFKQPYENISLDHPALVSCSNFVFPRPKDYKDSIYQSGYWFVEEKGAYEPSKELKMFLQTGDKPIYIGFGSVFNPQEKADLVHLIIESLKKCNKRGIISGMGSIDDLPESVIAIDSAPHSWLFDQVSLVCHHGGAGTTAAGVKAGVPSVIIPCSNDQFAWAHRAYDLGVSAMPIYKKELTADKLAEAINMAQAERLKHNAKQLALQIAKEHGAMDCAKVVVDLLETKKIE